MPFPSVITGFIFYGKVLVDYLSKKRKKPRKQTTRKM